MADYNLEGVRWSTASAPVTWSIAQQNYLDRNYQFSSFLDPGFTTDVQAVFAAWSSVANIDFQQVADSDQADIRIGFNSIDGPYGTAGITQYLASSSGRSSDYVLKDADIEMDSDEGWHLVDGRELNATDSFSFYQILLHEVGHALGLAHYDAAPAIMNAVTTVLDLTSSDIDGVQALYGARSAPAPVGGVGTDLGFTETVGDQGARLVDVSGPDVTVFAAAHDIFRNHGENNTRFVFDPGYGHDVIGGFVASGSGHSTVDLPSADFSGIADVLRHAQGTANGVVIHDAASGDTVRLIGVSRSDLVQNRRDDIALHG